jgi:predicted short-subunit dehydrogenase-like oxidoreductase (DUF2520 family)
MRVNLVGAGKVGRCLLTLLAADAEAEPGDVLSDRVESARAAVAEAGAGRAVAGLAEMRPADLWLVCVPDDKIGTVAAALAERDLPPAMAVHCSGFHDAGLLQPLRGRGWAVASCHPVRSFADPAAAARAFPGTPCGIEGDPAAQAAVTALVRRLGGLPFALRGEAKALYHAAAVFSNNFTVVLQGLAMEAWAEAGVAPEVAARLRGTLLEGTAANVAALGPAAALTGPAARGDHAVMTAQAEAIARWHPEAAELYRRMSALAGRLKRTGQTAG